MKHTTDSQRSATLLPCNPTADLDAIFRTIFDGNGGRAHGYSSNAFDTVAQNLDAYGKATHANWDYDASVAKQQGNSAARPISKAERRDKREDGKWVRDFVPATLRSDYLTAKADRNIGIVAAGLQESKRFRCEVTDKTTGERVEIMCKLITNTVLVASYGKIVEFRCTSRSKGTFLDCRDMKRKPLSFAKSELRRFLGITEGDAKFTMLTTFPKGEDATLSPGNPLAQASGHMVDMTPVAGSQGVRG